MINSDSSNQYFQLAARFINQTGQSVFLTGKAGTGKTTFLKFIKEMTFKKTVVVAPTGVAAINAGGVTMHSFFQLPLDPISLSAARAGAITVITGIPFSRISGSMRKKESCWENWNCSSLTK